MLDEIAAEIDATQPASRGFVSTDSRIGAGDGGDARAATEHGRDPADSGLTAVDMVAELRALRASVTHLWIGQSSQFGHAELEALMRFDEAIDQAIAEAVERYARDMEETRERFLAILSHDLRNPLGAITASASFLVEVGELNEEDAKLVGTIQRAAARMTQLVADMLELALHRLGDTMPIQRDGMNVGDLVKAVVAEVRASYPKANILVSSDGDLKGDWDGARLAQALTNLIGNAVQHGDTRRPIRVSARGDESEVTIEVRNNGRTIPADQLQRIFDAGKPGTVRSDRRHLGLGLFIVNKIVDAHGGSIEVDSANAETAFTIHLPRAA
jgi:signal transduction histidine kinase